MDTKEQRKLEETTTLSIYCHQTHVTKVIDNRENCCKYLQAKFALNFAVVAFNHISDFKVRFLASPLGSKSFKKSCFYVDFLHAPPLLNKTSQPSVPSLQHIRHCVRTSYITFPMLLPSCFLISSGQFVVLSLQMGREWRKKERTVWTKHPH